MMDPTDAASLRLVERFPVLRPVLEAHLEDQEQELLSYIFLADVERWAEAHLETAGDTISALFSWFDVEYVSGDLEIEEWITFGMLENIPWPPAPGSELRDLLGPTLRKVADRI